MRKVIICKGLPGSSKTTWTKQLLDKYPGRYKNICKDDLRLMLDNSKWSKANEKYVLQLRDHLLLTSLDLGYSVIISDTNFHPSHEERIRELVSGYNEGMYGNEPLINNKVQVEVKFFDVSPEECIKRDLKRPNSVGAKVIWTMYNEYLKPKEEIISLKQDKNLPRAIIIDLDGTVALKGERSAYDYNRVDEDLPNKPVIKIVENYLSYGQGNRVIFLSGREDSCFEKTKTWIKDNVCLMDIESLLLMRKTGDNRKDCIIKKEIFDAEIKDKYYIDFILDDRNQVVNMWRKMGLTCLQVADGNF